jgi:hypothetical protein
LIPTVCLMLLDVGRPLRVDDVLIRKARRRTTRTGRRPRRLHQRMRLRSACPRSRGAPNLDHVGQNRDAGHRLIFQPQCSLRKRGWSFASVGAGDRDPGRPSVPVLTALIAPVVGMMTDEGAPDPGGTWEIGAVLFRGGTASRFHRTLGQALYVRRCVPAG